MENRVLGDLLQALSDLDKMVNIENPLPYTSLISFQEGELKSEQCGFCLIPETKTTEYFQSIHGDIPHTLNVPGISAKFTILQDLVPIAEQGGHLLLMPNDHHISLATIEDQEALTVTKNAIVHGLRQYFPDNPIFTFEHGPGFIEEEPIACGGCHLDHAHGHMIILPKDSELWPIQNRMEEVLSHNGWENPGLHAVSSDEIFKDIAEITGMSPYIQIGIITPYNETISATYVQKTKAFNVPSQLLRAIISEVVYGQSAPTYWHWRDIQMGLASPRREQQIKTDVITFRQITGF